MLPFRATYRLQLEKSFKFKDAQNLLAYFEELGISHLYFSPIFESRAGSRHGYDALDPLKVSEERGGEASLRDLFSQLKNHPGITGVILDIVPNHVAADTKNPIWWDVLKFGQESKYWDYFDFRPRRPGDFRIVLPVLGRSRKALIAAKELKIKAKGDEFIIQYWDKEFPLHPKSYEKARSSVSTKSVEAILKEQNYVLEDWRKGSREINYRRFFDVNELAGVKIENEEVFNWAHQKIKSLAKEFPLIQGLRVDHIDGLTEPDEYLKRLSKISPYVWVEKILGEKELIPSEWEAQGTTGYEFSNMTARVFVDLPGVLHLHAHYVRHIDQRWERFHDCVLESKREMLELYFLSEITSISEAFYKRLEAEASGEFSLEDLREALIELSCSLRVYRTYHRKSGNEENPWLSEAFKEVTGRGELVSPAAVSALNKFLTQGAFNEEEYRLVKRWEQLTGPVMAKGLEDTALYRYFPLLSLNGVGGEPDWVGDGVTEFHNFNIEKLSTHPLSMSATSTHDTKRSEDVRSRIHVLSELSEEWTKFFEKTYKKSRSLHKTAQMDIHTEYLIFETLVGAWPQDGKITDDFIKRMQEYFLKASREAKSETSWVESNPEFEERLKKHIEQFLKPKVKPAKDLLKTFDEFAGINSFYGAFNSLSEVALKVMSPGLPDFYQGLELWDLSLVDPDNRRPVDFKKRREYLKVLKKDFKKDPEALVKRLTKNWKTGEIKLWLTHRLLLLRKQYPELFLKGRYQALELHGPEKNHFLAFLREHQGRWVLTVIPRLLARKMKPKNTLSLADSKLLDTVIALPEEAPLEWTHVLTGEQISTPNLKVKDVLSKFPVGVLTSEKT